MYDVVVADDWPDIRLLVRTVFEQSGRFNVVAEVENGADAAAAVDVHQPALVLLDLSMPVMDGLEALTIIRRRSPSTKIGVLIGLSAGHLLEAAVAGADVFVDKDDIVQTLVAKVLDVLETEPDVDLTHSQSGEPAGTRSNSKGRSR